MPAIRDNQHSSVWVSVCLTGLCMLAVSYFPFTKCRFFVILDKHICMFHSNWFHFTLICQQPIDVELAFIDRLYINLNVNLLHEFDQSRCNYRFISVSCSFFPSYLFQDRELWVTRVYVLSRYYNYITTCGSQNRPEWVDFIWYEPVRPNTE